MNNWLRLALVTVTVGGGFTLCTLSVGMLVQMGQNRQLAAVLVLIMIACSVFVTASGLAFVYDPRRVLAVKVALALQIPYISSPLLVYKLICGAGFYTVVCLAPIDDLAILFGHIGIRFQFGGYWSLAFWEGHPVGVGVNWVAVFLFVTLRRSMRAASPRALPTAPAPNTPSNDPNHPSEPL
jgi:hypothetical protein